MYSIYVKHRTVQLLLFTLLILVLFYREGQDKQLDRNSSTVDEILLGADIANKVEGEFNKRLLDSMIKPIFHSMNVKGNYINLFLDGEGWEDLSITQKSGVLSQVSQIWKETRIFVEGFPDNANSEIRFYDKDSNKELASWSEQQGGIIK
jgi:hypothetical protein